MNYVSILFYLSYMTFLGICKCVNGLNCSDGYIYYNNTNDCRECGLTYNTPNVKIVGGIPAVSNSWPAQALIVQNYKGYHQINGTNLAISVNFKCGGTLINSFTVLTAAHCINYQFNYNAQTYYLNFTNNPFYPTLEKTFRVYLGLHNVSFLNNPGQAPSSSVVSHNVSQVIVHPNYNASTLLNDIALLTLPNEVIYTSAIQPACVPTYSLTYPTPNRTSYAAGWGTLVSGGSTSDILYNVNLTIYNMSLCNNVSSSIPKNPSSQICAGEYNGGKDTCQGDSGGGIYISDTFGGKQRYMVCGVISYGYGCGVAGYPGIYTRLSYYSDWIKANWKIFQININTTNSDQSIKGLSTDAIIAIAVSVIIIVILIIVVVVVVIIFVIRKNKIKVIDSKKTNKNQTIREFDNVLEVFLETIINKQYSHIQIETVKANMEKFINDQNITIEVIESKRNKIFKVTLTRMCINEFCRKLKIANSDIKNALKDEIETNIGNNEQNIKNSGMILTNEKVAIQITVYDKGQAISNATELKNECTNTECQNIEIIYYIDSSQLMKVDNNN